MKMRILVLLLTVGLFTANGAPPIDRPQVKEFRKLLNERLARTLRQPITFDNLLIPLQQSAKEFLNFKVISPTVLPEFQHGEAGIPYSFNPGKYWFQIGDEMRGPDGEGLILGIELLIVEQREGDDFMVHLVQSFGLLEKRPSDYFANRDVAAFAEKSNYLRLVEKIGAYKHSVRKYKHLKGKKVLFGNFLNPFSDGQYGYGAQFVFENEQLTKEGNYWFFSVASRLKFRLEDRLVYSDENLSADIIKLSSGLWLAGEAFHNGSKEEKYCFYLREPQKCPLRRSESK